MLGSLGNGTLGNMNYGGAGDQYRQQMLEMQRNQNMSLGGLTGLSQQQAAQAQQYKPTTVVGEWQERKNKVQGKESGFMGEILKDLRLFIREHRSTIYTIAACLMVDHFFFQGKFKAKLHDVVEKFLNKATDKVDRALDAPHA